MTDESLHPDADVAQVDQVAEPSAPDSLTPGTILRQAREARGQSIADVVQVIRFSARQIEALERDDYASLPGSTAVRGLVRNYAKFLKLDAAPLLSQLDPAVPVPEADVRPPTNMGEAEQPTIVERIPLTWVAGGAVAVILALGGYWYASLPGEAPPGKATPSAPAAPELSKAAIPGTVVPLVQPEPAVVTGNPPVAVAAPVVPPAAGGLRVEFDDRSWIEIRDATQRVVFVGEYPAGTRQNVDGKAPFQVWIGKASGVRLFMGERSVDLKPHTREEVARFNLE